MMNKDQQDTFLDILYGDWESTNSKGEKYFLKINSNWFSLKRIDNGMETVLDSFKYLGAFDLGVKYLIRGGKSTYGVLSTSIEELVLGIGIGNPVSPQFEIFSHFRKLS